MQPQSLSQTHSKLKRFTRSGALLLESMIATSVIAAIALPQASWANPQPSSTQERPGTVSISARDLGGSMEVNCQPRDPNGIPEVKPSFCGGVGFFEGDGTDSGQYSISTNPNFLLRPFDPKNLLDFMQNPPSAGFPAPQERVEIFRVPVL